MGLTSIDFIPSRFNSRICWVVGAAFGLFISGIADEYSPTFIKELMEQGSSLGAVSGAYEEARKLLNNRLDKQSDDLEARFLLARLDSKTARPEEAAKAYFELMSFEGFNISAAAGLAYVLRYVGYHTVSVELYTYLAELDDSNYRRSQALSQISKNHIYSGDYQAATESDNVMYIALRNEAAPITEKHLFYSGLIAFYRGEYAAAQQFWLASAALNPSTVWARFAMAYEAGYRGDLKSLDALIADFEAQGLQDGERYYRMVHLYAFAQDQEAAADAMNGTVKRGFFPVEYFRSDPLVQDRLTDLISTELTDRVSEKMSHFHHYPALVKAWVLNQTQSL